jgi:hypothetical protein
MAGGRGTCTAPGKQPATAWSALSHCILWLAWSYRATDAPKRQRSWREPRTGPHFAQVFARGCHQPRACHTKDHVMIGISATRRKESPPLPTESIPDKLSRPIPRRERAKRRRGLCQYPPPPPPPPPTRSPPPDPLIPWFSFDAVLLLLLPAVVVGGVQAARPTAHVRITAHIVLVMRIHPPVRWCILQADALWRRIFHH